MYRYNGYKNESSVNNIVAFLRRYSMKGRKKIFMAALLVGVLIASSVSVTAAVNSVTGGDYVRNTCTLENVTTTVQGTFITQKTRGLVVLTNKDALRAAYDVPKYEGKDLYIKFSDTTPDKNPAAIEVINAVAAQYGCQVGPYVNIELGMTNNGTYAALPIDGAPVRMMIGTPGNFMDMSKNYAMIAVRPGGAVYVLPDLDTNPWSVTFDTTGGAGTYAIVRY